MNHPLDHWVHQATVGAGIHVLAITADIARKAGQLPRHHLEPLDRLIIATALHHQA